MEYEYLTLGTWKVKPGYQEEFIEAWKELNRFFFSLPDPPVSNTLVQNVQDDTVFHSVGPWRSLEAIQAMRSTQDPRRTAFAELTRVICDEAIPGDFQVIYRFPEGDDMRNA